MGKVVYRRWTQQQFGLLGVAFTLYSWLSACSFIIVVATVAGAVLAQDPGRLGQLLRARDPEGVGR